MNLENMSEKIRRKLTAAFAPILLEVTDESARHAGHAGARPGGGTHFHVKMISDAFKDMNKVARHRAVYAALTEEMREGGIHALALDIAAPQEKNAD
jgi:BolA protein